MTSRTVALVTLGCARNEVDSEELAGRLEGAGWRLVEDAAQADVAVVNTCGFVEAAKKDSIDVLLEAADLRDDDQASTRAVVAVGCLAERYGRQLADSLPEADAVLGFDSYDDLAGHLDAVLAGRPPVAHLPQDRRLRLPVTPVDRPAARAATDLAVPGHGLRPSAMTEDRAAEDRAAEDRAAEDRAAEDRAAEDRAVSEPDLPVGVGPRSGPRVLRRRLDGRPWAPLKIASGCDRRCAFCAIPTFRGSLVSRPPQEVAAEARWLVQQGVREVLLVSENSSSYGKDLADPRMLESLLPRLAAVDGLRWVRVSYLQPAEVRPSLLDVMTGTPGVLPYFDLPFQHASGTVLRRMRRFGDGDSFLDLLTQIRRRQPGAGVRSNVIVGFPGETDRDVDQLADFLRQASLDAIGVFGYSDEEGTEAASLDAAVPPEVIAERLTRITDLAERLTAERAEQRVGERVEVLVEEVHRGPDGDVAQGRAAHQGPDVDGTVEVQVQEPVAVGDVLDAQVVGSAGVDLIAVGEYPPGAATSSGPLRPMTTGAP
ncbi:MAG: 30S ribosomal protein S12 methylthiotransferase RimO [Angustibacter sp.]